MNSKYSFTFLLIAALTLAARADEIADKGLDIFTKNHHAVVTVELVQKAPASARSQGPREGKKDLTGTVVDPSGLTVVALSDADPSELSRRLWEDYKEEIEISDVRILLEDGTDLPAEIVLRDKDLDLAFLRPKVKPATPLAAIDLTKSGKAQLLEQVIGLNRLKRGAGRAYCASFTRISAVIQKPRTFYIPDASSGDTGFGSPVFTLDGNLLGVVVMRAVNSMGAPSWRDCVTAIVLPAADIMKAAAQAPTEVKPEEEKKDAPKEPAVAPAPAKEPTK